MIWLIGWTFVQLLVVLVILKWFLASQLCGVGLRGLLPKIRKYARGQPLDIFVEIFWRVFNLFALTGWIVGVVVGIFKYPTGDWYGEGLRFAMIAAGIAATLMIVPCIVYWTVVWVYRGLEYLFTKPESCNSKQ